jgi:hypothetical protein
MTWRKEGKKKKNFHRGEAQTRYSAQHPAHHKPQASENVLLYSETKRTNQQRFALVSATIAASKW